MTWEWWRKGVDGADVTPAGQQALAWAVAVIRGFFGENWLAENAARTGHVPLLNHLWWPLTNSCVIVRILELAARIALVTTAAPDSDLVREAKTIYGTSELTGTKFHHLCLTLETAAFAVLAGWSVSYEKAGPSGRRPDLAMSRRGVAYAVEVTALGLDREFRAVDRYCDELHDLLRGLEFEHGVELACHVGEILPEQELAAWLEEIVQARKRP